MNSKGNITIIIAIIVTAAVVFVCTSSYYLNNVSGKSNIEYVYDGNFTKLKNVMDYIQANYLFEDEYTMEDLEDGAIHGMVEALGDPYSSYFNKEETTDFLEDGLSEYVGVGITVTYGNEIEWPMVVSIVDGSMATEAGVKPGDYIYGIGDETLNSDITLEELSSKLKGPEGTTVKVTFVRINEEGNQDKYTATLERRKIVLKPVEYKIIDDNIGYIQLLSFDSGEDLKFISAYNELIKEKNAKGIIIDIRNNPGGLLTCALKIADTLLPNGVITYTVDKNGNQQFNYSDSECTDVPIVVLVNGNSASASEVLSAAIKDYGIGKIVGEKTFGKGLVQAFSGLGDGTYIKLTIAEYFSPNGTKINKVGVIPDVEIKDDENTQEDEQLQKAIEVMNELCK